MASRGRRGLVYNLLKDFFQISLYHKPTMIDGDIYYIVIIEEIIVLRMTLKDSILIIHDLYQLSSAIYKRYDELLHVFMNQTKLSVLIDTMGNTRDISSTCLRLGIPLVEEKELSSVSSKEYELFKVYFKEDKSKYGMYLLAVADKPEKEEIIEEPIESPEVEEEPEEEPVEVPNVHLIDFLKSHYASIESYKITTTHQSDQDVIMIESIAYGTTDKIISDVTVIVKIVETDNGTIFVYFNEMGKNNSIALWTLIETMVNFTRKTNQTIILYNILPNTIVYSICMSLNIDRIETSAMEAITYGYRFRIGNKLQ